MNSLSFGCVLSFWCNKDTESKENLKQCKRVLEALSKTAKDVELDCFINPGFYILDGTEMCVNIDTNSIKKVNELARELSYQNLLKCHFEFFSTMKSNTACGEVMWVCGKPFMVTQHADRTQGACNWLYEHGKPMKYYGVRKNSNNKWEDIKTGKVFPEE